MQICDSRIFRLLPHFSHTSAKCAYRIFFSHKLPFSTAILILFACFYYPFLLGFVTSTIWLSTESHAIRVFGIGTLCRAFNCRILYDHYLPTVILIIIGSPSPTHSFTLGLILPFLQILPTAAFPFSPSGFTIWISQTVYCYF